VSNDGLVYACDRNGSRVQVFKTDGTFVAEKGIERQTLNGTVFGIAFSPDPEQRYAYIPDGRNEKIWILERKSLDIIGSFGCPGHAGGCLTTPHSIATDAKGNIYIGETWEGKRVQRFLFKGVRSLS
jgi:sugar lactone lactonase YvrE